MSSSDLKKTSIAQNGISDTKPADHAWTFDEVRSASSSWTLAGDAGLLLHLQEFSQKLMSQTHEIQEQMDGILHDTKLTNVRMNNVFNDFIMLANTQFVENRVYDDDVMSADQTNGVSKTEEKEKTKEEREAELIPKISQAISFGLNVFDTAYDKLDMKIDDDSDTDDEDVANRADVIFEPKDPYINRPLPYLIGSSQFFQSDDLGLNIFITPEEHESEHEDDGDDEMPRETTSTSVRTNSPPHRERIAVDNDSGSESSGDLFGEAPPRSKRSDQVVAANEEDEDRTETTVKTSVPDFNSELNSVIGNMASGQPVSKSNKPKTEKKEEKKKIDRKEDLFGDAASDEDDIFSANNGLFSSTAKVIFDDHEDAGGSLFDQPNTSKTKQDVGRSDPEKPSSEKAESIKSTSSRQAASLPKAQSKKKGLFDEEDEEDLFAALAPKPALNNTSQKKDIAKTNLFGDDDDDAEDDSDIFKDKTTSAQPVTKLPEKSDGQKKLPAGAVSIFGGNQSLFQAAVKDQHKDNDSGSQASSTGEAPLIKPSLFTKSMKSQQHLEAGKQSNNLSRSPSTTSSAGALFTEDPELFASGARSKPDSTQEKSQSKSKAVSNLFDDEDDDFEDLFAVVSKPKAQNVKSVEKVGSKEKASKLLLEDDDEGDLFAVPKTKAVEKPVPSVAKEQKSEPNPASIKDNAKPAKKSFSLFDDHEDDDLFDVNKPAPSSKHVQPAVSKIEQKPASHNLFDDDDLLFGSKESDNSPQVDLFGSKAKKDEKSLEQQSTMKPAAIANEKVEVEKANTEDRGDVKTADVKKGSEGAAKPVAKPSKSKSKPATSSLFGDLNDDDDDGDLFSPAKTKKKTPDKNSTTASKQKKSDDPIKTDPVEKNDLNEHDQPLSVKQPAKKSPIVPAKSSNKQQDENDPLFGSPPSDVSSKKNSEDISSKPASATTTTKSATKSDNISKLQASMNINPLLNLPSALSKRPLAKQEPTPSSNTQPDSIRTESAGIDLEVPVQIETLQNISKDRAKIPGKRRPPSKSLLQNNSQSADFTDGIDSVQRASAFDGLDQKISSLTAARSSEPANISRPISNPTNVNKSKETSNENVIHKSKDISADDDLFSFMPKLSKDISNGNDSTSSIPKKSEKLGFKKEISSNQGEVPDFSSDSLSSSTKSEQNVRIPENSQLTIDKSKTKSKLFEDDDDLFGGGTNSILSKKSSDGDDLFSVGNYKPAKSLDKVDDDGFDLFGSSKRSENIQKTDPPGHHSEKTKSSNGLSSTVDSNKSQTSGVAIVEANDVSDQTKDTSSSGAGDMGQKTISSKVDTPASSSVLSDDIFAVPSKASSKPSSVNSSATKGKAVPVVNDDDDIFADSSLLKKATKPLKEKTKVEPSAEDNIFTASSSSVSKTKSSAPAKTDKKDDLDDDLFSTPRSNNKRAARKKPTTKDEDLFNDDTDIFADISTKKSSETKVPRKATKAVDKPLFTNDPDDIFAESTTKSSKSVKPPQSSKSSAEKKSTKTDPVDIFDDPLNALK